MTDRTSVATGDSEQARLDGVTTAALTLGSDDTGPWWTVGLGDRVLAEVVRYDTHSDGFGPGVAVHAVLDAEGRDVLRAASYTVTPMTGGDVQRTDRRFCRVTPDRAARPVVAVLDACLDCRYC